MFKILIASLLAIASAPLLAVDTIISIDVTHINTGRTEHFRDCAAGFIGQGNNSEANMVSVACDSGDPTTKAGDSEVSADTPLYDEVFILLDAVPKDFIGCFLVSHQLEGNATYATDFYHFECAENYGRIVRKR